ncbi:pilus assembly protein TadG-related protein [Lentibacillus cibarius]|uniref:Putative Flp pilus-assembly TadG-like N-terminal domain-containing protein n=1 Tax=Lentibacillus cibarius TaxID=2583219 RepID=A0A5S3QMU9_9BACI|nr:pilus assembly protein TadG-related protein [Lentibacillus cibarius]TMN23282.1 hypothetical protein FFL34_15185 [Lentibacillus cibarius]
MTKNELRNEKGSTTLMMMGLLLGIILMGFVFFDMSSVLMERRISQTGSDAAAIAAAQEAEKSYQEVLEEETRVELTDLHERTEDYKEDWEESVGDDESSVSWGDAFDEWINNLEEEFDDRSMPASIVNYLKGANSGVDIDEAIKFLWDTDSLSNLVCDAVSSHTEEIREAAQHYADLNGIENDISIVFPVENGDEGFKVGVRTKSTINDSFLNSVNTEQLKVPAHAIVNIQQPEGMNIICD